MLLLVTCLAAIFVAKGNCECMPGSKWMREAKLDDGKMNISWNFTDTDLSVMMMAPTKGWIAVGFGPKRKNFVDLAVGWVENGKPMVEDRYINDDVTEPTLDKMQSLELIGGKETDEYTCICFKRKLSICDKEDYSITEGTLNFTWAYGKEDPKDGKLDFASAMKGRRYFHWLAVTYPQPKAEKLVIRAPNTTVSLKKEGKTIYWCSYHKVEKFDKQQWLLGFDQMVVNRSKGIVHHILFYSCINSEMAKLWDKIDPKGHNCFNVSNEYIQKNCRTVLAVWAQGGENQYFPPSTGSSFGSTERETYFRLEVHYNVPSGKEDYTDDTGIGLYLTSEEPKNKLAVLFTAVQTAPFMVIPPKQKEFHTFATCQTKCMEKNIPKSGINVTGIRFHGHQLATKFRFHIFRKGKELKPIFEDNFDFEYQGFRFLKEDIKIYPTDRLGIECVYDTSKKNETTTGNEDTNEEMCLIYLMYYPRMDDFDLCMSYIVPQKVLDLVGIEKIGPPEGTPDCKGPDCQAPVALKIFTNPIPILKPDKYAKMKLAEYIEQNSTWTDDKVNKLKKLYLGEQNSVCSGNGTVYNSKTTDIIKYPTDVTPYKFPDPCSGNSQ